MLPVPTQRATLAFAGCAAVLLIGLVGRSPTTVVFATGGMLGLALGFSMTASMTQRLRRQRIELSWWHAHGASPLGSAAVVGIPFEVCCELRNRGEDGLWLQELSPAAPEGTQVLKPTRPAVWLAPMSRTQLNFTLLADAAGRVVLQGLSVSAPGPASLFAAPLYFPSPLTVQVLPQAAHRPTHTLGTPAALSVERPGQTAVRRRGDGTELRELRGLQPGDAFKSIAWRASARRGKLLVREMEREIQDTLYLIMDISGSMRGGALGRRRLDQAIELVAFAARDALVRGDQVGLITVDGRIVEHVAPGDGLSHMPRVYDALLGATEVVAADLTETTDEELEELVARYLRRQEGLDLRRNHGVDSEALIAYARSVLGADPKIGRIPASDRGHAILRRFCQVRGIPIPYRSQTRGFGKGRGLARAFLTAAGKTRVPRTIVTFSDFEGVELESLSKPLGLLKARAHALVVVYPQDHAAANESDDELTRAVRQALALGEARRVRELRSFLARARIPAVAASPETPAAQVVGQVLGEQRVA